MSGLRLQLVNEPEFDLDVSDILPENIVGTPLAVTQRLALSQGKRTVKLENLFEVEEIADDAVEFTGATNRLRRIGCGMNSGLIRVFGNAGDELGAGMVAGAIRVDGNTGDYLGSGMRGGRIDVSGSSGNFTGGALPNAALGMRDGIICIGKTAGMRVGERMRRGLIVINGDAGCYCGSNLIAGTIVVTGHTAPGIGFGMRRGSILLLNEPAEIPGTFNDCGTFSLAILALLLRHLKVVNRTAYSRLRSLTNVRRLTGDIGCDGQGELLVGSL